MKDNIPDPKEISLALKNVFELAKKELGKDILRALVPVNETFYSGEKMIPIHLYAEMQELCGLREDFRMIPEGQDSTITDIKPTRLAKFRTRVQVFVYCHILEADYPYVVLLNLLRASKGLPACWTFYERNDDDSIKHNKNGEILMCNSPTKKINHLEHLEKSLPTSISDCLKRLWSGDLRNAFSHSQYTINPDGSLFITKYAAGVSGHTVQQMIDHKSKISFCADEIKKRFETASKFLEEFCKHYLTAIEPFQDCRPQQLTPTAWIRWNQERHFWESAKADDKTSARCYPMSALTEAGLPAL
jgi:hypothetical protein